MRITAPDSGAFTITAAPDWPDIAFATDATGPHIWNWTIQLGSFRETGVERTPGNTWDAGAAIANLGGLLTVNAEAGEQSASIAIKLSGVNPTPADVEAYLATIPDSIGFAKILQHESGFMHFNAEGEPIQSFDGGYGMCQLTTPIPTFDQVCNWKRNIDAGLALFRAKRAAAMRYLSQNNRPFTATQLTYETVCRWNGGAYHIWDAQADAWVRNPKILCDRATGNIGWDLTDPANASQTEQALHQRDSAAYSKPPGPQSHWRYSGICYADAILG